MEPREAATRPKLEESKRRDGDRADPKNKKSFEKDRHAMVRPGNERVREQKP